MPVPPHLQAQVCANPVCGLGPVVPLGQVLIEWMGRYWHLECWAPNCDFRQSHPYGRPPLQPDLFITNVESDYHRA